MGTNVILFSTSFKKEGKLNCLGLYFLIFKMGIAILTLQFRSFYLITAKNSVVLLVIKISSNLGFNNKTMLKWSSLKECDSSVRTLLAL